MEAATETCTTDIADLQDAAAQLSADVDTHADRLDALEAECDDRRVVEQVLSPRGPTVELDAADLAEQS